MPGPFDTSTRYLVEAYPTDWLTFLGFEPDGPIEAIDANPSSPDGPLGTLPLASLGTSRQYATGRGQARTAGTTSRASSSTASQ